MKKLISILSVFLCCSGFGWGSGGTSTARRLLSSQASEGTGVSLLEHTLRTSGSAPFQIHQNSYSNTEGGAGTYNHGVFYGYNVGRHSTLSAIANNPSLIMGMEDNYYDYAGDLAYGMEWYIEYYSPNGTSVQGLRPFYTRILSDTNDRNGAVVVSNIGGDGTGQFTVKADTSTVFDIRPTKVDSYEPLTVVDSTEASNSSTASFITKGGAWIDKKLYVNGATLLTQLDVYGNISVDASGDRMKFGILTALPNNSVGAYIGWANGISGTLTGDLVMVPRTSVGGAIRLYAGSTSPVEVLTVKSGVVGINQATPASPLQVGTPVDAAASYAQIDTLAADTAGPPASGDCDASTEVGRMIVSTRYSETAEFRLWICTQTGASTFAWKYATLN